MRKQIDEIDSQIVDLISKRFELVPEIVRLKKQNNLPVFQPERERHVFELVRQKALENKLDSVLVVKIFELIVSEMKKQQENFNDY